jgi:hypothetical protein
VAGPGDFPIDSRYPNLVYKAHNFQIASALIIASPTRLVGGRAGRCARWARHCYPLFFIVSGGGEWARRGLILHFGLN